MKKDFYQVNVKFWEKWLDCVRLPVNTQLVLSCDFIANLEWPILHREPLQWSTVLKFNPQSISLWACQLVKYVQSKPEVITIEWTEAVLVRAPCQVPAVTEADSFHPDDPTEHRLNRNGRLIHGSDWVIDNADSLCYIKHTHTFSDRNREWTRTIQKSTH